MADSDGQRTLELERELRASCANVWRCWTEPTLLERWFCPLPWSVSDARLDLRPGGEFFTVMNGPDGERFDNLGVFLDIQQERKLVFTDAFLPGWIPSDRAFMSAEISLTPIDAHTTRYQALVRHWTAEAREEHEKMGFHVGWGKAADQLESLAQTL